MSKRWKTTFVIVALAVSIAIVLWLTLFSRLGSESRSFYPPFWSYRAILNGNGKALLENIRKKSISHDNGALTTGKKNANTPFHILLTKERMLSIHTVVKNFLLPTKAKSKRY